MQCQIELPPLQSKHSAAAQLVHHLCSSETMRAMGLCLALLCLLLCTWGGISYTSPPSWRTRLSLSATKTMDNDIMIYNTLTRKKEKFESIEENKVSFYSCGPTVYDYAHVGNFRAFLMYDVVKRWLQYRGYQVDHVCNLTDVDDKIIIKMLAEQKSLRQVTEKYTKAFFDDLDVLNIIRARAYPKATEYIDEIESMVQALVEKGHAYVQNGSVYFRVSSFPDYGQLANLKLEEGEGEGGEGGEGEGGGLLEGGGGSGPNARRGGSEKESSRDFALWKAFGESDGGVAWDAIFGRGRPGWHIECSAMCHKLLGPSIDIHAGGVDLVFPHHQNEVAQSEAFSGQQFSRFWMHNGFVNINNEKMSKSLKNFKTLRDIVQAPVDARAFRYMVVTSQYRQPLNFNEQTLQSAKSSLGRVDKLVAALQARQDQGEGAGQEGESEGAEGAKQGGQGGQGEGEALRLVGEESLALFDAALCDDLNTPKAAAALFKMVGAAEKSLRGGMTSTMAGRALGVLRRMDLVLGVLYEVPAEYFTPQKDPGDSAMRLQKLQEGQEGGGHCADCSCGKGSLQQVQELAALRAQLKRDKNFAEADRVRAEIGALGYGVRDGKDGSEVFLL